MAASLFNMSFLLAKPPPLPVCGEEGNRDEKSTVTTPSVLDTGRYPTNESALPRLASFYGATQKANIDPISALNTHLHPAAAGASFMLPARPRAKMLSPSDRHGHMAVGGPRELQSQFSSFDEEFGLDFPPDCGPTLDDKILSYKYAMRVAAFNHAGTIDSDGITLKPHSFDSDFGWFQLPLSALFESDRPENNVLEKYGIGITLWFKFLVSVSPIIECILIPLALTESFWCNLFRDVHADASVANHIHIRYGIQFCREIFSAAELSIGTTLHNHTGKYGRVGCAVLCS